MKALVLAAGRGERLRPLTDTRPKALVPIAGKPLLEHLIVNLDSLGIKNLVIVVGYRSDMVRSYFGDGARWGVKIEYANQNPHELTGEAAAILAAEKFLNGEKTFLMTDGDVIDGEGIIANTLTTSQKTDADITIALTQVADPTQYGVVKLGDRNRILKVVEKPRTLKEAPSNMAVSSVYVFKPTIFKALRQVGHLERAMVKMIDDGAKAYGTIWKGKWLDVGRPADILTANQIMLERKFKAQDGRIVCESKNVHPSAKIYAPTYIGPNVRVLENAVIRSSYIDEGATIGTNALVRDYSYIGRKATIGFTSEVARSVVMDETAIGHLAYVGDSIIGQRCEIGAGVITSNMRFDRKNVKVMISNKLADTGLDKFGAVIGDDAQIGVNVTIYPGRTIGAAAWIYPNVAIAQNIPSGVRVEARTILSMHKR
jgi:bifunctional UDP-N-acetylglucosamine pyrophosphorylase/glucosamine-1-phosphate N-acetyltransferase